jgi:hypothetical protein
MRATVCRHVIRGGPTRRHAEDQREPTGIRILFISRCSRPVRRGDRAIPECRGTAVKSYLCSYKTGYSEQRNMSEPTLH